MSVSQTYPKCVKVKNKSEKIVSLDPNFINKFDCLNVLYIIISSESLVMSSVLVGLHSRVALFY